jgi:rod shape-determining protein MreC
MRDSRRARIVLALLLLVSITFIVIDARGSADGLRGTASTVLGPLERAATSVARPVGDFFSAIGGIGSNAERADELQARNDELETRLRELESDAARVEQLDELLGLAGKARYRIVPAQVIAVGPTQGFAFTVTLDVGREDNVRADQSVINGQGLVGRVVSVGQRTSTVLLAIDPSSSVGARLAKTRQIGLIDGRGAADLELQLLNPRAELEPGDALVTFGSRGSPFVPGVPIGTVTSVRGTPGSLSRVARVAPYVDFNALDLVGVVLGRPADDPRDSLIPPSPTPTVPATPPPATPGTTPGGAVTSSPDPTPTGG